MLSMNCIRLRKRRNRLQNDRRNRNMKCKTMPPILFLALSIRYWIWLTRGLTRNSNGRCNKGVKKDDIVPDTKNGV